MKAAQENRVSAVTRRPLTLHPHLLTVGMSHTTRSLCPGYKQVDSFCGNEEYEEVEEVEYVTLDLGNTEPTLVPNSSSYRLIVGRIALNYITH